MCWTDCEMWQITAHMEDQMEKLLIWRVFFVWAKNGEPCCRTILCTFGNISHYWQDFNICYKIFNFFAADCKHDSCFTI